MLCTTSRILSRQHRYNNTYACFSVSDIYYPAIISGVLSFRGISLVEPVENYKGAQKLGERTSIV